MQAHSLVISEPLAAAGRVEPARYRRWFDAYCATIGSRTITLMRDRPFAARVDYIGLGEVSLSRFTAALDRIERSRHHVAGDGDDRFVLVINRGAAASRNETSRRERVIAPGAAVLVDLTEPTAHLYPGGHASLSLYLPRAPLKYLLPRAEDSFATVIPAENAALRLLVTYADSLLAIDGLGHPAVAGQAGQSLIDLAALAFGIGRDHAETARSGGARAAWLAAILERIRLDFTDPEITGEKIAAGLGISTRHLQDMLHQTGASFSERVQELRLARAMALLSGEGGAVCKVSDAAYRSGFGDLSNFNRQFRRRYGMTPKAARGAGSG